MKELEYPFDNLFILNNKKSLKKSLLNLDNFIQKNIAILSGSTIGEIKNILEIFLLNYGIKANFFEGQYNRFYEEGAFFNKELKEFCPDIIYIHTTNKNISEFPQINDTDDEINLKLDNEFKKFKDIWDNLKATYNCTIIQNNFELSQYRLMGNMDIYNKNGSLNFINELNQKFYNYARNASNFFINDINYLSAYYGLEKWFENSYWYLYKYALSLEAIPLLCYNIASIIKSLLGKNKKSLILDLDNTLWGGIIADDGLENIKLGLDSPEGMIFYDFQKYIKGLSRLGISLNVCSKNEEDTAYLGFDHRFSILNKNDFISFKANWNEKYKNILEISNEINIGTDSMVFIDDNPVERDIVKNNISDISIIELTKPEDYLNILDKSNFFELTILSNDDKSRNEFYKANIQRNLNSANFKDYNLYLKSLNMKCEIETINETNILRVTQLINKTNQFNFTTKRYTESEIKFISNSEGYFTLSIRLKDKFGDNGIVSVVIASVHSECIKIDLWVMSCRVFKRNLEFAVFDEIIKKCVDLNVNKIRGIYIPSKKNIIIKDFYNSLGFKKIEQINNTEFWEYIIPKELIKYNTTMEVIYE